MYKVEFAAVHQGCKDLQPMDELNHASVSQTHWQELLQGKDYE